MNRKDPGWNTHWAAGLFTDCRFHDFYRAEACLTASEARNPDGFVPPPLGAEVWMEFERGDPDFPVWTGCLWVWG